MSFRQLLLILVYASLGDELPKFPWLYRQFHGVTNYYFFPGLNYAKLALSHYESLHVSRSSLIPLSQKEDGID